MPPRREKNDMVLRARALRRDMTLPEGMLWQVLRQRPDGCKFRRQHPIGRCVVDFYCAAAHLVRSGWRKVIRWVISQKGTCGATIGCVSKDCGWFESARRK